MLQEHFQAGAFALVRFRSVPGSAKDIAIVFFAMASGLACGLGYVTFACVFVVIMIVILILLTVFNFAQPHTDIKQLRITIPESLNYSDVFDDVMNKFTEKAELRKVKTTNMGTMFELSYNVVVKDSVNEKEFIDNLRMRNGNLNISLSVEKMTIIILIKFCGVVCEKYSTLFNMEWKSPRTNMRFIKNLSIKYLSYTKISIL